MPAERRGVVRAFGVLLGGLLLTGCWEGSSVENAPVASGAPDPAPGVASYVALGDSFTAAPYVPVTDVAEGCFRSDGNYPALLADRLRPERFVDVSCGAATTADLTSAQATIGGGGRVPPQLRAVREDTDLVTLGIGANDEDFFAGVASTCVAANAAGLCTEEFLRDSVSTLPRTGRRVTSALRAVQRRAPEATVVLVGYPRLVAPQRSCEQIPVPRERLAEVAALERRLNQELRAAAGRTGVEFVDMHRVSRGHEICSPEPWVNGVETDAEAALALHPFADGQAAVAEQVLAVLEEDDRR